MQKTVLILKRDTSESFRKEDRSLSELAGYLLKVKVEVSHNIDANIFVMHRDVISDYAQPSIDTFYSIASVGEMEWIPAGSPDDFSTNFFRISEIELMFESKKELELGWEKISKEVYALAEANDLSLETRTDLYATYPLDALYKYYGPTDSIPSVDEIDNLQKDLEYAKDLKIFDEFSGSTYYSIVVPEYLRGGKIYVDNNLVSFSKNDINLITRYGANVLYTIYTTDEFIPSGFHNVKYTK